MDTPLRKEESPTTGGSKPTSVWRTPRFQRFIVIVVGTGLLLSLVAILRLKAGVDNLTSVKVPHMETLVNKLVTH